MKKKILILSGAYFPKHVGGAEVAIKEITDRLEADRYEFHMVTNRFDSTLPKIEQVGNVLVHRIGFTTNEPNMADLRKLPLHLNKLLFQYTAYRTAKLLHRKNHYDAIWAVMAHSTGVPAALFKKKFSEVTYILTLQEGDPPEYIERKMRMFGSLFKNAFRKADVVQSISTFLSAWAAHMGYRGDRVVIPNGVDFRHFSQPIDNAVIENKRRALGLEHDKTYLVTTSRLVHKNGIDTVIRALTFLPDTTEFVIFGTGPEETKLKMLADTCGVTSRVHFKGQADRDEIPLCLKACDIFIRPSRSEGMGNSFIEAMAAGLPVVGTNVGGIVDFLFDARETASRKPTGWVVKQGVPKDVADAVQHIVNHPYLVNEVKQNAYNLAKERYDWDLIVHNMQELVFSSRSS